MLPIQADMNNNDSARPCTLKDFIQGVEKSYLAGVMKFTGGNLVSAGRIAGIAKSTLSRKLKRYGIARNETPAARIGGRTS